MEDKEPRKFEINFNEDKQLRKFQQKHFTKCISGVSIIFTPTGIADKVEVKCTNCGKVKDISDYSCW